MKQIRIATEHRWFKVEPLHITPSGRLAVHHLLTNNGLQDNRITITHVPTGFAVLRWVRAEAQAETIAFADELDHLDWDFNDPTEITQKLARSVKAKMNAFLKKCHDVNYRAGDLSSDRFLAPTAPAAAPAGETCPGQPGETAASASAAQAS